MSDAGKLPSGPLDSLYAFAAWTEYQDLVKALGELTLKFSLLHFSVEQLVYAMTGVGFSKGALLLGNPTFGPLNEKAKAIAKATYSPVVMKTLEPLLKKAEDVNKRRNDLVHAFWLAKHGEPTFAFNKRTMQVVGAAKSTEISQLNDEIADLALHFIAFKVAHHPEPGDLPKPTAQ